MWVLPKTIDSEHGVGKTHEGRDGLNSVRLVVFIMSTSITLRLINSHTRVRWQSSRRSGRSIFDTESPGGTVDDSG